MKRNIATVILSLICLSAFLLESNTVTADKTKAHGTQKFTCIFDATNPFPDGTTGVAEEGVKITGKGETVVVVDYYSDNYANYLGMYQELNGNVVPTTEAEACQFAFNHYSDRQ